MVSENFDVQSVSINVNPDKVFEFLAEPTNVPKWAVGFSEVDGKTAIMETPSGKMKVGMEMICNKDLGTIDTLMTMPDGSTGKVFSRVTENDGGASSVFTFVLMAPPVPLEEIEGTLAQQKKQLAEELLILKSILEEESKS
ncbi:MAG: SRPBCC family protein [Cyclobacteriaceae bacterium]